MRLYPKSEEEARRWKEDYEFMGVECYFDGECLVVPEKRRKKPKDKKVRNQRRQSR